MARQESQSSLEQALQSARGSGRLSLQSHRLEGLPPSLLQLGAQLVDLRIDSNLVTSLQSLKTPRRKQRRQLRQYPVAGLISPQLPMLQLTRRRLSRRSRKVWVLTR